MDVADDAAEYCRQVEAYLCRKNGGHLIRIVGPAFESVCGWATRGVPLTVAYRGIDRHCERYYAKGPRRRPVRIEFCEADVLDVFDEWRRAVGVTAGSAPGATEETMALSRKPTSLPGHLERTIARLTALRSGDDTSLDRAIEAAVREIDAARAGAKALRGAAREQWIERLRSLDIAILDAARRDATGALIEELTAEAETELAPFRDRMPPEAYAQSKHACLERLIRERFRLPMVVYE